MSHLRTIMQKLGQSQPELTKDPEKLSLALAKVLQVHLQEYQQKLSECTPNMLQYEWVWLEEHLTDLQLCLNQPQMLEAAGGQAKVEFFVEDTQRCKEALQGAMLARNVQPASHPQAVAAGEHAWEVRQETIKKLWGLG